MSGRPWVVGGSAAEYSAAQREGLHRLLGGAAETGGGILLNTCHRVELYGFGDQPEPPAELPARHGEDAVVHLLRVAAGLESAVVGEDEVLHQVREALRLSAPREQLDGRLRRLFELAVAAGRRARAGRTAAGAGLAGRALGWLGRHGSLAGRPVLVAGAGRMGSALAHAARKEGALVTIASRDPLRAARLALVYDGKGVDLAEGAARVPESVAVAIALSGPWHELGSLAGPLPPIADISAPSAVPGSVRERLNGGFLGVDDLFSPAGPPPPGYVRHAEEVVAAKAAEYLSWLETRS